MISAGPRPSSDGSMPRSTRNGAPMRRAMSRGVTKRRLSQLVPCERQAFAERAADRVGGNEDPLRASGVQAAQLGELCDEWGKHSAGHLLFSLLVALPKLRLTCDRLGHTTKPLIQIHRSTESGGIDPLPS